MGLSHRRKIGFRPAADGRVNSCVWALSYSLSYGTVGPAMRDIPRLDIRLGGPGLVAGSPPSKSVPVSGFLPLPFFGRIFSSARRGAIREAVRAAVHGALRAGVAGGLRLGPGSVFAAFVLCLGLAVGALRGAAAEVAAVEKQLRAGKYQEVIETATKEFAEEKRDEEWPRLLLEALTTVGRYADAATTASNAVVRYPRSMQLRWLASQAYRHNGNRAAADAIIEDVGRLVSTGVGFGRDAAGIVAIGRVALVAGSDPKSVLSGIFQIAEKSDPQLRDTYLARGELALEKSDFDLAAKAYTAGLAHHPEDPDLLGGLAQALISSDRPAAMASLEAALKANPKHIPSLLTLIDHSIDAEEYGQAEKLLREVASVNPQHPEAWAYRAVLAHLKNNPALEAEARRSGLASWTNNPAVDHLIGRKLSAKYRFAEGAEHQRQALALDPTHLPAKLQLAEDLLRLGEDEGWDLAAEVHRRDAYGTTAFNLVTLSDTMAKFAVLTNAHFIVRMNAREADIFGGQVMTLLERAHARLVDKYGVTLQEPTHVEIFDSQKDFGVRTFGMPDNPGYLGVCFGRVITANSPAANKGMPVNWQAVLWHEFCHVVTLQLTANRMPRWLSEGISVYEELQENGSWGQSLTPRYRSMIVGDELTPVSKLSGAFLAPKTPFHLQFAYFEASMVIEFMVVNFGTDALKAVLRDLREGKDINDAIGARMAPMETFETRFSDFAKARARGLAPGLAWDKPKLEEKAGLPAKLAEWAQATPTNYWALQEQARGFLADKKWAEAKGPLLELTRLYPGEVGPDSGWARLAAVHQALGETNAEYQVLTTWVAIDDEAPQACRRLMEMATARGEWATVITNAERYLSLNPLVSLPYQNLARAQEAMQQPAAAIGSWQTLLKLDPPNPAEAHFQLARLLAPTDVPAARRHVLQSLEDAPRNREALRLLTQMPSPVQPKPEK